MDRNTLISYALKYQGDYRKIYQAIKSRQPAAETSKEIQAITFLDEDYPLCFLALKYPPLVLFYKGKRELLKERMASIVGSRNSSSYGEKSTLRICSILSPAFCLVSGMARGIDSVVHQSALYHGKTIGVLGCGIDRIYPKENAALYR
jgi:DNA processing protein